MKQRFIWLIVCGMFFGMLGFLFAGLGMWAIIRATNADKVIIDGATVEMPIVFGGILFCAVICVLNEILGAIFLFFGIRSIPNNS